MAISGVTGKDYTKTPACTAPLAGDGPGRAPVGLIGGSAGDHLAPK